MREPLPIQVVVGATASGKSAFAENLAFNHRGEILNCDSQQFYRGLDIGTGKVPSEKRKVPYHLLDICPPGRFISAGEFARRADELIGDLAKRGKVPVVVGGTGLYIRALLEGLDPLPERDEKIREELHERFCKAGGAELHAELQKIDPISAAKISVQDEVRLVRYLEIHRLTGKPPSHLMSGRRQESLRYESHIFWLRPPRELLRRRIASRVKTMFAEGWVDEVRKLLSEGVDPRRIENKPIGYAEIAVFLESGGSLEEIQEKIILKTQQYAKRQETFFRGLLDHRAYREAGCEVKILD